MAKPKVFISSTYYDLKHLRSSLDNFIESLGFEPILSEKGDIAYSPDNPLDESCYREVNNADIFVLIIGGRYGSESSRGKKKASNDFYTRYDSITKEEFKTSIKNKIPTYILIEKSVYSDFETYLRNKDSTSVNYAHVDSINIFNLIEEILALPQNNPVYQFDRFSEIEIWLIEQWAGLFKELLKKISQQKQHSTLSSQVSDLSEKISRTFCMDFDITQKDIETFYKMSGLTYAFMNRREALTKMLEDIGSAQKSVEMYARVYISELIKDPAFVSAIEKVIHRAPVKNGLRIKHVSTNYSNDSLVEGVWKLEDPSKKRWKSIDAYRNHLKDDSNAPFDEIKEFLSKKEIKCVIFERAYLNSVSPLPFSILSIDDKILYISFYDLGANYGLGRNYGTYAPTIRLLCKKNCKKDDEITWVDLFLNYKQKLDEELLSEI